MLLFLTGAVIIAAFACGSSPTGAGFPAVELTEIDDVLENPFKGFAPWIGDDNPVYEARLQEATFAWRDLEPQKGVYNWARLEKDWGNVAVTGKRVGFRVAAEIPGSGQNDIPQYLIDAGVAMRPYSIDGHDGLAPDWDDSTFLAAHHDFIMALGNRYDRDNRVAWIDIGSYGFWGEWHVWRNEALAASQATKQTILEHYFEAFPTKMKVIAFDDDFATRYVTDRGGGIRNDCLGTQDANEWYLASLNGIDPGMNERVWKTAIITGEFCGSDWGAIQGTTDRFQLNLDFIKETHWSFIGSAGGAIVPRDQQHRNNLDLLHKTLGYRFVLRQVDIPETISAGEYMTIRFVIENKGVAPFYFNWPVVLDFVDDRDMVVFQERPGVNIRQWLPGIHAFDIRVRIPDDMADGIYDLKLAIHDPETDRPGILFANSGKDETGRYLAGRFQVES